MPTDVHGLAGDDGRKITDTPVPKIRAWVYPREDYWAAVQMMANRMSVSEQKYGPLEDNYPEPADSVKTLHERLDLYLTTGNTEWLLDVANQAVIEFLFPSHPVSHFRPTDSDESPGLRQR
jgi:hypothetical protein